MNRSDYQSETRIVPLQPLTVEEPFSMTSKLKRLGAFLKKSFLLTLALHIIGFTAAYLLFKYGPFKTDIDPAAFKAAVDLRCTNIEFEGDVGFVTEPVHPLEFTCNVTITPAIPKGYTPEPANYDWSVSSGEVTPKDQVHQWRNPAAGLATLAVSGTLKFTPPARRFFFLPALPKIDVPFKEEYRCLVPVKIGMAPNTIINNFVVGNYPDPNNPDDLNKTSNPATIKEHIDIFMPPKLFYEVTQETFRIRIFEDYTLGEFDLDPRFYKATYPRYVTIHPTILRKIARLEKTIRDEGQPFTKFNLIYGFRSPEYNLGSRENDGEKSLKSPFSQHMYGRAVDIIVDEDHDLVIDDLNKDGTIDIGDARTLLEYVDKLDNQLLAEGSNLIGGAFTYPHHDFWERGKYVQTPYLHTDTRGYTRSDGTLIREEYEDTIGITKKKNPYKQIQPIPPWPF